jgi:hypothetical protein
MGDFENRGRDYDVDRFSRPIKAGKRTYFFDVKSTRDNDYYLTITESKRHVDDFGKFTYEKHKIFLYKEDFAKFVEGLQECIDYVKEHIEIVPRSESRFEPDGGGGENSFSRSDFGATTEF